MCYFKTANYAEEIEVTQFCHNFFSSSWICFYLQYSFGLLKVYNWDRDKNYYCKKQQLLTAVKINCLVLNLWNATDGQVGVTEATNTRFCCSLCFSTLKNIINRNCKHFSSNILTAERNLSCKKKRWNMK